MLAELEGDAAEDEREDHQRDGQIERVEHDPVDRGKCTEERPAEHHQPALVRIPDAAQARHHDAAPLPLADEEGENPDAEVEAIEHNVEGEKEAQEGQPGIDEKALHGAHRALPASCGSAALRLGSPAFGRWPTGDNLSGSRTGTGRLKSGPLRMRRHAKVTKVTSINESISKYPAVVTPTLAGGRLETA